MPLHDQALAALRGQVADIISGTFFVFVGLAACGIAAMRRRSGVRLLVWLGMWSAMYGALRLMDQLAAVARLPNWFRVSATYLDTVIMALMLVVATRAWLELSRGKLRPILQALIYAGLLVGLSAIGLFVFTGSSGKWMPLMNSLLATCALCLLTAVMAVPRLAHKFLITPDSGVLLAGTLVFGLEALSTNVLRLLGYQFSALWDSLGFAALLFSFGYVALQMVFASERRLLAIENELAIAREIQTSILPRSNPEKKPPYHCRLPSDDSGSRRLLRFYSRRSAPRRRLDSRRLRTRRPCGTYRGDDEDGGAIDRALCSLSRRRFTGFESHAFRARTRSVRHRRLLVY